ncbi:MAG: ISKra4 family transposase, partial [Actinomycetota bacterium]|nr:ISKra4 family transposase [Actinomycetota bacterium]
MFQEHLDLRSVRETRVEVVDADGVAHRSVEAGHVRPLTSIFGPVSVERLAYRHRGHANLYPADGGLNLPAERQSHGLRSLAAIEATRGSFEDASAAIARATGQSVAKRQVEGLTARAATDVEGFYETRTPTEVAEGDVVVISVDGKGIVMRPDALRPATAKAAAAARPKLDRRVSKGEKRNRKRMAEVGAVYDLTPQPRTPSEVMARPGDTDPPPAPAPAARNKWVTASVVYDAATVVAEVFDQAERRDPAHRRTWVALVDGNNHQINRIGAEAAARGTSIAILIDLIHVIEYLWGAAWYFYP